MILENETCFDFPVCKGHIAPQLMAFIIEHISTLKNRYANHPQKFAYFRQVVMQDYILVAPRGSFPLAVVLCSSFGLLTSLFVSFCSFRLFLVNCSSFRLIEAFFALVQLFWLVVALFGSLLLFSAN
jgi:hypothetical protein